jgi:hypothetical protein
MFVGLLSAATPPQVAWTWMPVCAGAYASFCSTVMPLR